MKTDFKSRAELLQELHRIHGRKNFYKAQARQLFIGQVFAGLLALVGWCLLAVSLFGAETERPAAIEVASEAVDCPDCDPAPWSSERPTAIATGFTVQATTPEHVLASVHMANGRFSCSGTVIGDEDHETALIVSAAHCVAGNVGNSCWWHLPTGEPFRAKLVAFDRGLDVSVFTVNRSAVLAATKLAEPGTWSESVAVSACGYPSGRGPNLKTAEYAGTGFANSRARDRWLYAVRSGQFAGGDSGGGLFFDGLLAGVVTHTRDDSYRTMMAVPQPKLFDYVTSVAAQHAPGVPIAAGCDRCPPRRPAPPDYGDEQAPSPPPGWRPSPNVPIVPPERRRKPRDDDRDKAIAELKARLDELAERLENQQDAPGSIDFVKIERELERVRQEIEVVGMENTATLQRLEALEKSIAERLEQLPDTTDDAAKLRTEIDALRLKITAIENAPRPHVLTVEDVLDQLPPIPVRVVDEQGRVLDSETYRLGETITLFGRYRSRAKTER